MKTCTWYVPPLVVLFTAVISGLVVPRTIAAEDHGNCRLAEDIAAFRGQCTRCSGVDPCGWNCHGATSHAHGGKGGTMAPEDLGLRWGERYRHQPVDEDGNIISLSPCDIVIFGVEIPDRPDDSALVTGFRHSATATGDGTVVWHAGENPVACNGCVAQGCMHLTDANVILLDPIYARTCVVFPGSAFGDGADEFASLDGRD